MELLTFDFLALEINSLPLNHCRSLSRLQSRNGHGGDKLKHITLASESLSSYRPKTTKLTVPGRNRS